MMALQLQPALPDSDAHQGQQRTQSGPGLVPVYILDSTCIYMCVHFYVCAGVLVTRTLWASHTHITRMDEMQRGPRLAPASAPASMAPAPASMRPPSIPALPLSG